MRRKRHNLCWADGDHVVQQLLILSDIIHTDIGNKPRTDDAGLIVSHGAVMLAIDLTKPQYAGDKLQL